MVARSCVISATYYYYWIMSASYDPQISIDVLDYCVEGDEFDEGSGGHIFTLEVKLHGFGGNNYIIRRSYASIHELDAKLRRTFPKSNIISLPLRSTEKETEENFRSKLHALGQYFGMLLEMPEILRSNDICIFLDFEYTNGVVPSTPSSTSVLGILLDGVVPSTRTVIRTFEIPLKVMATDVIAWSFSTKARDIGFNITLGNVDLVAYQRYNSHMETIMGTVEVPHDGTAILQFDNTYSKIMAKTLTYTHAVLTASEIEHKTSSIRQCLMYGKWRSILKRCLMQQAVDFTPRGSLVKSDQLLQHGMSLEEVRCHRLENELDDMKSENEDMRRQLLQYRQEAAMATSRSQEQDKEIDALQIEVTALRETLQETERKCADVSDKLLETQTTSASTVEVLRVHAKKMLAQIEELQSQNQTLKEEADRLVLDGIILRDTITTLKGEKKKLREFCIDMKGALVEAKTACEAGEERQRDLLRRAETAEDTIRTRIGPLESSLRVHMETMYTFLHDVLADCETPPTACEHCEKWKDVWCERLRRSLESIQCDVDAARVILEEAAPIVVESDLPGVPVASPGENEPSQSSECDSRSEMVQDKDITVPPPTSAAPPPDSNAKSFPTSSNTKRMSFSATKDQLKSKIAAAALAASQSPMIKRRDSDGSVIKRKSSEAKGLMISGLMKAASKLETTMDRAFTFLDIEGLLEEDNDESNDASWHNKKPKPPGLGTYYI